MTLAIFGFLNLSFIDVMDISLVALIIFVVFRWIKDSSALNIFIAVIFIYALKVVVDALNMKLMNALLGTFIDVGVLALIIIFQPEIRHFLMRIGSGTSFGAKSRNFIWKLLGNKVQNIDNSSANEIAEACRSMSEQKTGALIVLQHKIDLEYIINTGDKIDADINRRLIMNLFFKNSPLHDGAVVIRNSHIAAARCTLPITGKTDLPAYLGMRHKAAIGITEETDAHVIVVSEETGQISYVRHGELTAINNINELKLLIGASFS